MILFAASLIGVSNLWTFLGMLILFIFGYFILMRFGFLAKDSIKDGAGLGFLVRR